MPLCVLSFVRVYSKSYFKNLSATQLVKFSKVSRFVSILILWKVSLPLFFFSRIFVTLMSSHLANNSVLSSLRHFFYFILLYSTSTWHVKRKKSLHKGCTLSTNNAEYAMSAQKAERLLFAYAENTCYAMSGQADYIGRDTRCKFPARQLPCQTNTAMQIRAWLQFVVCWTARKWGCRPLIPQVELFR